MSVENPTPNETEKMSDSDRIKSEIEKNTELLKVINKFNDITVAYNDVRWAVDDFNDEQSNWMIDMKEPAEFLQTTMVGAHGRYLIIKMNSLGGFELHLREKEPSTRPIQFSGETGLNMDWVNQPANYVLGVNDFDETIKLLQEKPMARYFEVNSSHGTEMTPEREAAIKEIDSLIDEINNEATGNTLTKTKFSANVRRISDIIYGRAL